MYGTNPPPPPPPAAPSVDLDDLFGIPHAAPAAPPPPSSSSATFAPNGHGSPDLPPPPAYWDGGGSAYPTTGPSGPPHGGATDHFPHSYPQPYPQPAYSAQHQQHQQHQPQPYAGPADTAGGYPRQDPAYPASPPYASQPPPGQAPVYAGNRAYPPQPSPPPPQPPQPQPQRSQEDEDREQLEKIIRLRKELEAEQQKELEKKRELETWGCPQCTYRNPLHINACEMCSTARPGYPRTAGANGGPPAPETAWQCGRCLAPNGPADARCRVCAGFRSSGTPIPQGPPSSGHSASTAAGGGGGVQSRTPFTTNWRCSVCGKVNPPSKANCVDCNGYQFNGTPVGGGGVLKHTGDAAPAASAGAAPLTWQCSVCTLENKLKDALCVACQSGQRPRHLAAAAAPKSVAFAPTTSAPASAATSSAGDTAKPKKWPCPQCTFLNNKRRSKCDMCAAPRPEKYAPDKSDRESAKRAKKREDASDEDEVKWQDDDVAAACNRCHQEFGFMRRRHHCRACGYVFCATCSPFYLVLKKDTEPQRVCVNCYEARQGKDKK